MTPDLTIVHQNICMALAEDIGTGDVTAELIFEEEVVSAQIITREDMILCGRLWVDALFSEVDRGVQVDWLHEDGSLQKAGTVLCNLKGAARSILTAERTALNFLQTLSATSTQVYDYVIQLKGSQTQLLDTRKTIPGLRHAQKYAVFCGGGINHRQGLFDAFLIKENHIKACGTISKAIKTAREKNSHLLLEVEVENLHEFEEALAGQPDRIMLDNFSLDDIYSAVEMRADKKCELEVSGNIYLTSLKAIAETGVDFVSVGAVTKSIQAIDLSLLIL